MPIGICYKHNNINIKRLHEDIYKKLNLKAEFSHSKFLPIFFYVTIILSYLGRNNMQIRPMEMLDVAQVVKLENQTWNRLNIPTPSPVINKEKLINQFENDNHFLVAEENNQILGVLDYHCHSPFPSGHHVVTFSIAITEDSQWATIGQLLIESFFQFARADDYKKVLIHVLSTNHTAIDFYKHLGFELEAYLSNQFYIDDHYTDDCIFSYYLEDIHAR